MRVLDAEHEEAARWQEGRTIDELLPEGMGDLRLHGASFAHGMMVARAMIVRDLRRQAEEVDGDAEDLGAWTEKKALLDLADWYERGGHLLEKVPSEIERDAEVEA